MIATILGIVVAAMVQQVPTRVIPDGPSCASCRIVLSPKLTLGTEEGPAALSGNFGSIQQGGMQRYWVSAGELPLVFAPNGTLYQTVKKGGGPGEYQRIFDVFTVPGDSTAVVDAPGRLRILDRDLVQRRVVTGVPWAVNGIKVLTWPTALLFNGDNMKQDLTAKALVVVDVSGSKGVVRRSFTPNAERASTSVDLLYMTTKPRGNEFWALSASQYQLTRLTQDGMPKEILKRQPAWFREKSTWGVGDAKTSPSPRATNVHEDATGLLWVYIHVPRPDYAKAWSRAAKTGELNLSAIGFHNLYRTRIEVIDPKARRVVAELIAPGMVQEVFENGDIAIYDEPRDVPQVKIFRVTMRR